MQDRFKFRIWDGSEMHYNDFVVTATGYVGKITEEFLGRCVFNQEDLTADKECILMQCTGLKDKNGNLIFEGDIVKNDFAEWTIKYCDKCKSFQCTDEEFGCYNCLANYSWQDFIEDLDDAEIIGNIHETPKLLKDGE